MKALRILLAHTGAYLAVLAGVAFFVLLVLVAFAIRIVYETVMLPVNVYRAERDGRRAADSEPLLGAEAAVSWPEHLVAEDRDACHAVATMSDDEAYPATGGVKCTRCQAYSLGWFGQLPAPLLGPCVPHHPV